MMKFATTEFNYPGERRLKAVVNPYHPADLPPWRHQQFICPLDDGRWYCIIKDRDMGLVDNTFLTKREAIIWGKRQTIAIIQENIAYDRYTREGEES